MKNKADKWQDSDYRPMQTLYFFDVLSDAELLEDWEHLEALPESLRYHYKAELEAELRKRGLI